VDASGAQPRASWAEEAASTSESLQIQPEEMPTEATSKQSSLAPAALDVSRNHRPNPGELTLGTPDSQSVSVQPSTPSRFALNGAETQELCLHNDEGALIDRDAHHTTDSGGGRSRHLMTLEPRQVLRRAPSMSPSRRRGESPQLLADQSGSSLMSDSDDVTDSDAVFSPLRRENAGTEDVFSAIAPSPSPSLGGASCLPESSQTRSNSSELLLGIRSKESEKGVEYPQKLVSLAPRGPSERMPMVLIGPRVAGHRRRLR